MRILVATVTAGGGHLAAAAALEEAWKHERPADSVERWDLLDLFAPVHRQIYSQGYLRVADQAPELWGMVFRATDNPELARKLSKLRRLFSSHSRLRFRRKVEGGDFDVVLCTHYLPLETLGQMKAKAPVSNRPRPFVASVVTDFEAHALWMEPCVDLYCVAHDLTKGRLVARGVAPERVAVTGIPIAEKFSATIDRPAVCKSLGIREDLPLVLVLSGGFGMGPVSEILSQADKVSAEAQFLVVAGRNDKLRRELAVRDYQHPTRVLGFASNMHELMAISSVIISKPGGLTTSEALAVGKPLLIVNPIPGQEAANSDFLLERGAALKANRVEDVSFRLLELLEPKRLGGLARSAKRLGRPEAARTICREVVQRLPAAFQKGASLKAAEPLGSTAGRIQ